MQYHTIRLFLLLRLSPKVYSCILIPLLLNFPLQAAFEFTPTAPLSAGLCGLPQPQARAPLEIFSGAFVGLGSGQRIQSEYLAGRLYQLAELRVSAGAVAVPLNSWSISAGMASFGNDLYRESMAVIAVAAPMGIRTNIGAGLHYYDLWIQDYQQRHTAGISLALRYQASPTVCWSTRFRNLNHPRIGQQAESLPRDIQLSLGFSPVTMATAIVGWSQDIALTGDGGRLAFGLSINPKPWLAISTGYIDRPELLSAACKINISLISVSYAAQYHVYLQRLSSYLSVGLSVDSPFRRDFRPVRR